MVAFHPSANSANKFTLPGSPDPKHLMVVMVAIGQVHQQMLELTKPRVEKVLGLTVHVINSYNDFPDAADPFEIKLQLLSKYRKPIVFIDTDVVLFGWNWRSFDDRYPHFVLDKMSSAWPGTLAIRNIVSGPCVNSGVWYAPLGASYLFEHALQIKRTELKDFPYALGDQTPLNVALARAHKREGWRVWRELPATFNVQLPPNTVDRAPKFGDFAVHLVGGTIPTPSEPSDPQSKLRRVRAYCEKYPL